MNEETKQIMEQMEKNTRIGMNIAYDELCKILKPINVTKLTYTEKRKFLDNNGFNNAWTQIKTIIKAHQWLYINCVEGEK